MRSVNLEYGVGTSTFEVPNEATVIEGPSNDQVRPPLGDPVAALRAALAEPLGMEPLDTLVNSDSRVTLTVNDWMGGSFYAAPIVLDILRRQGVKEGNLRIMIAGGTHAKVTRRQLYVSNMGRWKNGNNASFHNAFRILPPEIIDVWSRPGNDRIERHDAADPEVNISLGSTSYGGVTEVNKVLLDSDVVVHLGWGPVPLSPWGGFLGGGLLGLTSARSILGHHCPDVMNHPESTHSNPERQLFAQCKKALLEKIEQGINAKVFMIDPYFNVRGDFAGRWWAGHWRQLREVQVPYAMEEFSVNVPRSADILLLDCPPWMFHGSTHNPLLAMSHVAATMRAYIPPHPLVRKGGVVICVTSCDGEIDDWYRPSDREVISLYAKVGRDVGELFDRYAEDFLQRPEYIYKYRFCYGHHPLHAFWLLAAEQYAFDQVSKIIFAGAPESTPLLEMGITAVDDFKRAWELALATVGKSNPDVTVLPKCSKRQGLIFRVAEE